MASLRYGVYLLPAQPLAAAVAAVHDRLARGRFPQAVS
jgi:hypothetical protein